MVIGFSLTANYWLLMVTNIGKFSPHREQFESVETRCWDDVTSSE